MMIKKTVLLSVFVIFSYSMFSIKAAENVDTEAEASDKTLLTSLFTVVLKCFKDADWGTCGEMLTVKYDISQPKYKACTCHMACAGDELGLINKNGEGVPAKFLEYLNRTKNPSIKNELQVVYDKCQNVKGSDKCDLSEKFAICAFTESPALKDRVTTLVQTVMKMKQK
ncbi:Pheromone/general odorant binding protein [Cinara cedri]|uniref:Pheromone/general odorant binding protein n=1 Tax=Cinara cedri TaxID=506608 RepID=A0A5E4NP30_9HEMI|nr:Pheromone/general odorant binding protein [Cinara cedri]